MKVAVYGKNYSESFKESIDFLFKFFKQIDYYVAVYEPFLRFISENSNSIPFHNEVFNIIDCKKNKYDLIFSVGGDGTFLECASLVKNCDIPIVGINSGRLGFLADISQEELPSALSDIHKKKYTIEERTLLELISEPQVFEGNNFALNEITIQKRDTGSMINIQVFLNNIYINTYWADGLIISTPTGSTAYSLSVGGPIVVPGSKNFIITPIAPHNLTVRPIVVPDSIELTLKVESRSENYMATVDYKSEIIDKSVILKIKAADFKIKTLKTENKTFFSTLRTKLMWGFDKRN
jgi:NAD+ kinase